MKKLTNERHTQIKEIASTLDILVELNKRNALDIKLKKQLAYLESKKQGLQIVLSVFEEYAKKHWRYMTDVMVDPSDDIQCNLLVLTSTHLYTMEINHFEGDYVLKDGVSFVDGYRSDNHPIRTARNVSLGLQNRMQSSQVPIDLIVKSAAIFTNSRHITDIRDEVRDIDIIEKDQLEDFIQQMVREENELGPRKHLPKNHIQWVTQIDDDYPFHTFQLPDKLKPFIKKGPRCVLCDDFNMNIGRFFTFCPCGAMELSEHTIERSVYQCSILSLGKDVDLNEIYDFFDNQVSTERIAQFVRKKLL